EMSKSLSETFFIYRNIGYQMSADFASGCSATGKNLLRISAAGNDLFGFEKLNRQKRNFANFTDIFRIFTKIITKFFINNIMMILPFKNQYSLFRKISRIEYRKYLVLLYHFLKNYKCKSTKKT